MDKLRYAGHDDAGKFFLQSSRGALIEVVGRRIVARGFKDLPVESGQAFIGTFYHTGQHLWIRIPFGWGERAFQVLKAKAVPALLDWIERANAALARPQP